ncbi:unnamed protein product [Toxocara canis]|uniref:Uncharacterized protein n=1 Tax=Toxocara canis TaxID=6265 RepID=A0A3P7FLC2_TOXCA|nr:unnamed protein product [Toxocara canis]
MVAYFTQQITPYTNLPSHERMIVPWFSEISLFSALRLSF